MLYTNFQGHGPFGSREDDFFRCLLCMGMAAISVILDNLIFFSFLHPMEAQHKTWFQSAKQFLRKIKLKNVESE